MPLRIPTPTSCALPHATLIALLEADGEFSGMEHLAVENRHGRHPGIALASSLYLWALPAALV